MARLQILELPTEHHGDDMTTPFVLVIDQWDSSLNSSSMIDGMAKTVGARAALCFEQTIDIPANHIEVESPATGKPPTSWGWMEQFRAEVQDAIRTQALKKA